MNRGPSRRPVAFESEGAVLRGFLYPAARGAAPYPTVVMAHGTSATTEMVADRYAEVFAAAGVSALLYDHRNFGRSDGEPRQEINPWVQCRGFRDAVTYAETIDDHDPARIALWGDSYSAGGAFLLAAADPRVKAVVGQCPVFGARPPETEPSAEIFDRIRETLHSGDVSTDPDVTGPLPVVSPDQLSMPSLLQPIQAFRWFIEYGGRHGSGWLNRVTRVIPSTPAPYSPFLCAPFVHAPSLMMVAPGDEMVHADPDISRQAFDLIPAEKELYEIEGGHFGLLYEPSPLFDEASAVQADFLRSHLTEET